VEAELASPQLPPWYVNCLLKVVFDSNQDRNIVATGMHIVLSHEDRKSGRLLLRVEGEPFKISNYLILRFWGQEGRKEDRFLFLTY
jgi:hypothetical protein